MTPNPFVCPHCRAVRIFSGPASISSLRVGIHFLRRHPWATGYTEEDFSRAVECVFGSDWKEMDEAELREAAIVEVDG